MTRFSDLRTYYRFYRLRQMETYGSSGLHINGVDQRQFEGGGAHYGSHALCAYSAARLAIYHRKENEADLRAYNKRRLAALRGWRTRRMAS